MTAITWTGTTSNDWFTTTNWSTSTVPTSADDVTISSTGTSPLIKGTPSITIKSLTMNGTDTLTLGDSTSGNAVFMTVTNGIALSGGASILGQGNITANITVSGPATIASKAENGQNTPQLEIFGTITDSGNNLTLSIGNDGPSVNNLNADELILTKDSQANALNFNSGTGQLTLQEAGANITLTMSGIAAIGNGTVFLAGAGPFLATFTDISGATIGAGTITGIGKFNSSLTASGAATILTAFGTLEMGSAIANGGALKMNLANSGDKLLLDGASAATTVTFAAGTVLELNTAASLTVTNQMDIGGNIVQLDGSASALNDVNAITLSTGTITGVGHVVASAITASDTAHITATGGLLQLAGAVTDSGSKLTMTINGSGDTLLISNTAVTQNLSFNSTNGTLEIGSAGALTVNTALAIGTGTVKLDGPSATLTAPTVSLSTGTIIGAGSVFGNASATGAAQFIASGGVLDIDHPDGGSALVLKITGDSDTLKLGFDGTAKTVDFNGHKGTLNIHNFGGTNFTVTDQLVVGTGTILLDTAQSKLTDASGVTLAGGSIQGFNLVNANLSGFGTLTGAPSLAGAVTASGGTLDLTSAIGTFAGLHIANGSSNVLQLDNSASAGAVVHFDGATGVFNINSAAGVFAGSIDLKVGSDNVLADNDDIQFGANTVIAASLTDSTHLHAVTSGGTYDLTLANAVSTGTTFADFTGSEVFLSTVPCFCRGTLILTEAGEVAVEDLKVGDRVVTLSGEKKPIVWIGMGRDLVTTRNSLARPIIVRQGALAEGVPASDLYVTHGHGLYLDGVLIPVENLVNHRSILWDESARVVEYYHIELEDHDVLLANGAPAESYYDASNRARFQNTRPGSAPGDATPTFAPVLNGGPVVERAWMALFERADGRIASDTTDDPEAHLVIDGLRLDPAIVEAGIYSFAVTAPPAEALSLNSRSGVPSLLGVTAHDHRRLGIAIRRIVISQPGTVTMVEHDATLFAAAGAHPAEAGYAWTDGELTLPAPLFAHLNGPFTLAVHTEQRGGMRYPRAGRDAQEAA